MKKNIVIIGSTGSIGSNTLRIIKKNKEKYSIRILSTNKNVRKILRQASEFNVKNIIINDELKFKYAKKKYKSLKINFYNSFSILNKLLKKKEINYSMISATGIAGIKPALDLIKYSKYIAIANKESIICGWNLIKKELLKHKTTFIPIDSEHFSIFSLIENHDVKNIDKVFITASGGPFLNIPQKKIVNASISQALKHPNWKMGEKISIDSSTMMNKVFEVIEAKKIFNIDYKNINILIHPKSYVHAIVKFKNQLTKILIHDTDMKIPINNSLLIANGEKNIYNQHLKPLNLNLLNNLNLKLIDKKKFPLTKILDFLPSKNTLFETVLISINDYFVEKFLKQKINYGTLLNSIFYYVNHREFKRFRNINPKNINHIYNTQYFVYSKLDQFVYKKTSK
jgi:1-deoxy-D-xylulose-5-phosphate reductoisomerase